MRDITGWADHNWEAERKLGGCDLERAQPRQFFRAAHGRDDAGGPREAHRVHFTEPVARKRRCLKKLSLTHPIRFSMDPLLRLAGGAELDGEP